MQSMVRALRQAQQRKSSHAIRPARRTGTATLHGHAGDDPDPQNGLPDPHEIRTVRRKISVPSDQEGTAQFNRTHSAGESLQFVAGTRNQ